MRILSLVESSSRQLGGYDGTEVWTLRAWERAEVLPKGRSHPRESVVTTLHEWLHHELQTTTLWGLLTRFVDEFRRAGVNKRASSALFWIGILRSQDVHEVYATTLSTGVDAPSVAALADNAEYTRHRARARLLRDVACDVAARPVPDRRASTRLHDGASARRARGVCAGRSDSCL